MPDFKLIPFCSLLLLFSSSILAIGTQKQELPLPNIIQLSEVEQAYLKDKQRLTICVDPDWMPFEKIENGQHIGMSADFMRLFSKKINIPFILVPTKTWVESLELGRQRKCDVLALALNTPEREKFLAFSEPYVGFPLVIASRYEQIFINDIASILDEKLGVQKGYAYSELLRMRYPNINLIDVNSLEEGLELVSNNQLSGMIGSLPRIAYVFKSRYMGKLKISGKLDDIRQIGVGVRNDEPLLVGIFNKAIASIDKKERTKITSQWMTTRYELGTDYKMLITALLILSCLFLFFLFHYLQLRKYNRRLEHLAVTDKLTNISNRIKLDQQLEKVLSMAKRYQRPFSIILMDMDYFKAINDNHGHLVGDYVLQTTAQLLKKNIRIVDTVGRWGGEEFLIICPEQTVGGTKLKAEKIRKLIANYPYKHISNLSCSIGVSSYQPLDTRDTIIKRADDALYLAKNKGRNCVCVG